MTAQNRAPLGSRLLTLGAGILLAPLLLTGCVPLSEVEGSRERTPQSEAVPPSESAPRTEATPWPEADATEGSTEQLLAAAALAIAETGGYIVSVEREDNGAAWEVHLLNEQGAEAEITVSGDGLSVVVPPREEPTDEEERRENRALLAATELGFGEALNVVLKEVPEARILEISLDDSRAGAQWEAELVDTASHKHEIEIDAVTGTVLKHRGK